MFKCGQLFILNTAWLVLGIVLYKGSTSKYGEIIQFETNEWSLSPISDIKFANQECPWGYETLITTFAGTETFCERGFQTVYSLASGKTSYTMGACF